ncbi:MAG TPA: zinc-ribbon domain-containing protein [Candidatus Scatomorpha merdigallinarum]|nr:zinc-ribbon domain-containing protein [Candidatus Scatomorpha merdigallinarum]
MRKTLYDFCEETGRTLLLEEWDELENGSLTPRDVSYGSKVRVHWRCAKGHVWETSVTGRTSGQTGCPYCTGRLPIPGENDLATLYPELAAQWDREKNAPVTPDMVLPGSHRRAWWRCEQGHSWSVSIKSRTCGSGCPVCANRKIVTGENDLATACPELALEWDEEKNAPLTPHDVFPGSGRRVWWRCDKGHTWRTRISSRYEGAGCPYCAGKLVAPGENDLASANPELAAEWHPTKNGSLTPHDVTPYSNRRVWWLCPLGHEYPASVGSRNSTGSGCPYCTSRKVLRGFNDLATVEPKVAKEWAQDMNGLLTPSMVTTGSHKRVWWRCAEGHVWRAVIFTRARGRFAGCPVCAGRARRKNVQPFTYAAPPGARLTHEEEKRL